MSFHGIAALRKYLNEHPNDKTLPIDRDIAQLLVDAVDNGLSTAIMNWYMKERYEATRNAGQVAAIKQLDDRTGMHSHPIAGTDGCQTH